MIPLRSGAPLFMLLLASAACTQMPQLPYNVDAHVASTPQSA